MSDEFFERRVGTVINGKWTLEKLLGVGGMAAVYLGVHHIGRRDAIKILHPAAARSPEIRARFEQEARAVSRLGHPGAARIDDIDRAEDGSLYMVMELLDGESLGDRLERGVATTAEALRWADELLDVLGAAHALGIVHRDVKPDNVFVLKDGSIKLLDFGVAHVRDDGALRTSTGVALGTLEYMAPEQVRGERVDARTDLFAVGATIVRAVAGKPVHESTGDAELYLKMGTQPAPAARTLLPAALEALWPLVDHALAFGKEHRYPSAQAMREDVQALRAGRPASHALAAKRLEPTVVGASPTLNATVRASAGERRPAAGGLPISPKLIAVLVASILAGVGLAWLVLSLVRGEKRGADAAGSTTPSASPVAPAQPGPKPPSTKPSPQRPGPPPPKGQPLQPPQPPGKPGKGKGHEKKR